MNARVVISRVIIIFLMTASFFAADAQTVEKLSLELKRLSKEIEEADQQRAKRVKLFSEQNNVPVSFRSASGNLVLMIDVGDDGIPQYITTDNEGAAITTGVTALRENGGLGLNLQGEGLSVGIWDGGSVSHNEFIERVNGNQGSDDSHANHVTGTISAKGTNPAAKGMAPKVSIFSFDFNSDASEMLTLVKPDQTSLLLSNHSYGLITGWYFNGSWQWFGGDGGEDYRFGYYSGRAAQYDQIAFNAPYYSIIKSAGNDRSDVGNGSRPPDCNGGSGYDCISDVSTAKNIITVGAVSKITNYTSPSSVVMSSFSSWGPTDDGRIKPDLVAAGVALFSTTAGNNYGNLSGTSMATPNATGSLVLLQELYKNLNEGNFMRASTLKALAIHTTKEAGFFPGPDYRFGWGLLNVEEAAKVLLAKNNNNVRIEELTLLNGEEYQITLTPKRNEKITATIVWTDPAGTPTNAVIDPTDLMLVNDLDLRIIDDGGNEEFPWILNPAAVEAPASRGDNFRDNVEKIEFSNPLPRNYKLVVRHKGTLAGGQQNFSLILQYTSTNDSRNEFYWVGGASNEWSNPLNWSATSGGSPSNVVPGNGDKVIIDENSFNAPDQTINLTENFDCASLTWLTDEPASISLNGNTLTISGDVFSNSDNLQVLTEGTIRFTGESNQSNQLLFNGGDFSKANLVFEGDNVTWQINNLAKANGVDLKSGNLIFSASECELKNLVSSGSQERSLNITNSKFNGIERIDLSNEGLSFLSSGSQLNVSTSQDVLISVIGATIDGELKADGSVVNFSSGGNFSKVYLDGDIQFNANTSIQEFTVKAGSSIKLAGGKTLSLGGKVVLESISTNKTSITTTGAPATIAINEYVKLCYDHLIINGINISGDAVVNAGSNSTISNALNWLQQSCESVLFPKFSVDYECVGGLTQFTDESDGAILTRGWNFGNPTSPSNTSTLKDPWHSYNQEGTYNVILTVSNSGSTKQFTKQVVIESNPLPANQVVLSGDRLFSFKDALAYQWYFNNEPIEGATGRAYEFEGQSGVYFVVTKNDKCSRISESFVVTGIDEEEPYDQIDGSITIYPNPAVSSVNIEIPSGLVPGVITMHDFLGRSIGEYAYSQTNFSLPLNGFSKGIYFLRIVSDSIIVTRKIVITD